VDLTVLKLGTAVVIFGFGLLGGVLPWGLRRTPRDRWLALADTFAGGVLGGAGLLHLLGSGIAGFAQGAPTVTYPLALLIAGVGFLLLLLIEGVVVADRPGFADTHGGHHARLSAVHEVASHPRTAMAAAVLLIVLSVHSVILGVALGAQRSVGGAILVFLAVIAHKSVAGFALGISYLRSGLPRRRALPGITAFAVMTPLGILIGTGVYTTLSNHPGLLLEAVFDSIGAGTFLYIAALDIIRSEFDVARDRLAKWCMAAAGFAVMAAVAIWL
jgi:solute carrier family 39 (zinc transporter), member 1/2/3